MVIESRMEHIQTSKPSIPIQAFKGNRFTQSARQSNCSTGELSILKSLSLAEKDRQKKKFPIGGF